MKLLLADSVAPLADRAFALSAPSLTEAWLGAAAYAIQLFFDFAGYSAMAIGLGLMIGFTFTENFNAPYISTSVTEFWRRWHISLSNWLRDYLYIPLGGNRNGTLATYRNLMLTMVLGFALPILILILLLSGVFSHAFVVLAALSQLAGTLFSRWLFFAEAQHAVSLYYGSR